jgi:hypothetical protein
LAGVGCGGRGSLQGFLERLLVVAHYLPPCQHLNTAPNDIYFIYLSMEYKMSSWKSAESRVGVFIGAKGLKKSGRAALSGSNSGQTRADTPHPTIVCETKRDKKYLSVVNLWQKHYDKEIKNLKPSDRPILIQHLPTVSNNKIKEKTSDIICFHNEDAEQIANKTKKIIRKKWSGNYPSALTLYNQTISIWKSSPLDINKKVAHCAIFSHGRKGFWIIINENDIEEWWKLVLEARIQREDLIKQEEEFIKSNSGL